VSEELEFHPIADLFPLMEGEEFDALVADIKAHGLREDIDLFEDKILDGRNRYRACLAAGVVPRCRVSTYRVHHDPAAYVISRNIRRRHLTAEQKRDLIAKLLKAQPEKSDRQIAKQAKVDHHKVGKIRKEVEATGEVSPVEKRVGADGKARKQPAKKKQPAEKKRKYVRIPAPLTEEEKAAYVAAMVKTNEQVEEITARYHKALREKTSNGDDPGDSDATIWRRGLLHRAQESAGHAAFEDWSDFPVDDEIIAATERATEAWGKVTAYLHELRAKQKRKVAA
jgi:hypothetical protein